jgi:hypothetical protein
MEVQWGRDGEAFDARHLQSQKTLTLVILNGPLLAVKNP